MANGAKKGEEESGEFADFMADISEEIAQRVESLDSKPKPPEPSLKALDAQLKAPEPKAKPPAEPARRTPAPVDAGVIVEWPNIADRMIEEVR